MSAKKKLKKDSKSKLQLKLVLPLLFLFVQQVYSQDLDIFKFQYNYLPDAAIAESNDSARSSFQEWNASLVLPVIKNDKWIVLVGGLFNLVSPQSDLNPANNRLYFLAVQCTAVYKINIKQSIIGIFLPGISSTLEDPLSTKDFLGQLGFSYIISPNSNLTYGFGGVYNSSFGFPLILPLLTLQYQKDKSFYDFTFPSHAKAIWNYKQAGSYGIKATIDGSQYNAPDQNQFNGSEIDVINFSRILLGPEFNFKIGSKIHFSAFAGLAAQRLFQLNSSSGNNVSLDAENGAFFSLKLSLKPPQKHK